MLRALAILSILGAVILLTSGLAVWCVFAAGYSIRSLMKPRNPHALAAKQSPAKAIADPRHAKRAKAQRRKDWLRGEQEQERDG